MAETVKLCLTGILRDGAGVETVTHTPPAAEYYEKNGSIYLLYEETPKDLGAAVKNTLKLKSSVLELTRRGAVNAHMIFEAGREHPSDYATPYGRLQISVRTQALEISSRHGLTVIRAEYSLTADGLPFSDCSLEITLERCIPRSAKYIPKH